MRKAAGSPIALALGLVAFTACQSADRSPVASTPVAEAGQDQGSASAAADPAPVPGKPGPIPIPGRGGSGGKPAPIPVPGAPGKTPNPGATPTPSPSGSPGASPTPTPGTATQAFNATGLPRAATGALPAATATIRVSGVTGPVKNLTVTYRATIPNNLHVDDITLGKQMTLSPSMLFASLYSDTNEPKLSGANLGSGTNCVPFGPATTSDDRVGTALLSEGSAPYSGVFRTEGTLTGLALTARTPADGNGDYLFTLQLESGGVGTLECVTLVVEYQLS